jgi:hypothetical protein
MVQAPGRLWDRLHRDEAPVESGKAAQAPVHTGNTAPDDRN